ncbi:cytochrome P450 [Nemania serpens]|nr:cytochrome P450 [Nemania serpens]
MQLSAMLQLSSFWDLVHLLPVRQLLVVVIVGFISQIVYNLKFHPLSNYPGPKIAAVSNLWWALNSISGRYPWVIEETLRRYGDVIRIAPNELVFLTPQAAKDIYLAQENHLESFVQVGYDALDTGDNGISGEPNPVRHREVAKRLAPAFSNKNLIAKEMTIQRHMNQFLEKMEHLQGKDIELRQWSDWLALDLSAEMTYGRDVGQVRDMKDSIFLNSTLKLNLFLTLSQITRKFNFAARMILTPFIYLSIPLSVWLTVPTLIKTNTKALQQRIDRRGNTEHLDYLEQLLPFDKPLPGKKELFHIQNVAGQLLLASWQPLANQFYTIILFLLKEPYVYAALVSEVRAAFLSDADITIGSLAAGNLRYLQACVSEGLRIHAETVDGLPRISPGTTVDGHYVPQGVICQISYFSATRSPRFFREPLRFRPERWLPRDDPRFDPFFESDDLKASKPFSQGLRGCPGGSIATAIVRLFVAKVVWRFNLETTQNNVSFDKDFKFMTFWERPDFLVRMTLVKRPQNEQIRLAEMQEIIIGGELCCDTMDANFKLSTEGKVM